RDQCGVRAFERRDRCAAAGARCALLRLGTAAGRAQAGAPGDVLRHARDGRGEVRRDSPKLNQILPSRWTVPTSVVAPLVPRTKSKFAPRVQASVVAAIEAPATKLPCAGSGPCTVKVGPGVGELAVPISAKFTLSLVASFTKS